MSDSAVAVRSQSVALAAPGGAMVARLGLGLALAVFVTIGLLWTMHYLIATGDETLKPVKPIRFTEYVRVKRTPDPLPPRKIEPPVVPETPPDAPPAPSFEKGGTTVTAIPAALPSPQTTIRINPTGFNLVEGDALPIFNVIPDYPHRARKGGIEGYCTVQFTVTAQGAVRDPVVVRDQCTHSVFDRSSIEAALKSKYKPRVMDGQPVEVTGRQIRFTYEMEE